jgi:tellurite resistance protein TerC
MSLPVWGGFLLLVLALLALDLGVFHRKAHAIGVREAMAWTAFWIALALAFDVAVYFLYRGDLDGSQAAVLYLTGYLVEKSLSLDNIFVIALVFLYLQIPRELQHRVLYWGILGALVLRGTMIGAGTFLVRKFDWTIYVFGAILLLTAVRLLLDRNAPPDLDRSPAVRLARRLFPVTTSLEGNHFFVRREGAWAATPLFLALVVVEISDLLFAVDSIPAIFAITQDPFLVYTSNVFAILGLRSLYFALAAMLESFRYLKVSLVLVLLFVAVKMILSHHYPISATVSFGIISGILTLGALASIVSGKKESGEEEGEEEGGAEGKAAPSPARADTSAKRLPVSR